MVAMLSQSLEHGAVDYDPFAEGELARVVPTTEPQREVWLADRLGSDASLAFNESVSLRLKGHLDADALQAALQALVDRHDALRASFGPDGETLCVRAALDLNVQLHDLTELDIAARDAAMAERLRLAVDTPFALERDPLLRAELVRLAEDDHRLILTAHHIVCDGWSWWVLVRELAALYAQYCGAGVAALPEADSFADYALAEARHPGGPGFAADEAYWLDRFAAGAPVLDLPSDRPRPQRRSFASRREDYSLDADLVAQLRGMGARRGMRGSAIASLLLVRCGGASQWTQLGCDVDGESARDYAGGTQGALAMSADGTAIAVGASGHDGGGENAGHVRVFDLAAGSWSQRGADIRGERAGDRSGSSVAMSADGRVVAVGEPDSEAGHTGRFEKDFGQARVFEWRDGA